MYIIYQEYVIMDNLKSNAADLVYIIFNSPTQIGGTSEW